MKAVAGIDHYRFARSCKYSKQHQGILPVLPSEAFSHNGKHIRPRRVHPSETSQWPAIERHARQVEDVGVSISSRERSSGYLRIAAQSHKGHSHILPSRCRLNCDSTPVMSSVISPFFRKKASRMLRPVCERKYAATRTNISV